MKFTSLADAEDAYAKLESESRLMLSILTGITTILTSLIAKHSDYTQFQLHLTTMVEMMDVSNMGKALTASQREVARAFVEQLQQIQEVRGEIRPLDF